MDAKDINDTESDTASFDIFIYILTLLNPDIIQDLIKKQRK